MASEANTRLAKNAMLLYIQQLVIMGVTLFTFRLVLKLLGEIDYGAYSVIAGVIVLFSFLNGAMTQATQRYLSYYLGKKDQGGLAKVFSMSVNVYLVLCLVLLIVAETLGIWFLHNCIKFPAVPMSAVNVVY